MHRVPVQLRHGVLDIDWNIDAIKMDITHMPIFMSNDPSTKLANVSDMVRRGCTLQTVVEEIRKCRVLWSRCHREYTAEQFHWGRSESKIK